MKATMKTAAKTTWKRIIAAILCAVIAITAQGAGTAFAAGKKLPLKAAFKGTSLNLLKDLNNDDCASVKIETIEKKWGKPSKKTAVSDEYTEYVWKKGKTSIEAVLETKDNHLIRYLVEIGDKNGAMCGIKVGMKKAAVLKKMQKMFGKKNVMVKKDDQGVSFEGEPAGDGEMIQVTPGSNLITLELKDGKVSYLFGMFSI